MLHKLRLVRDVRPRWMSHAAGFVVALPPEGPEVPVVGLPKRAVGDPANCGERPQQLTLA